MEKVELDKLTKLVDDFVTQLKKDLLVVRYKPAQTGVLPRVWDRMKNWWHNTVMGGNNPDNPYVYKNKFGALGHEDDVKKESNRLTLSQYNFIKEQYNKLESELSVLNEDLETESENLKNLKLFRIIDSWADKFKKEIIKQFSGAAEGNAESEESVSGSGTGTAQMDAGAAQMGTNTAQMGAIPGATSRAAVAATRGNPARVKIYWSKDGWGPKEKITSAPKTISEIIEMSERGRQQKDSINHIKRKVFEKLSENKDDHPDYAMAAEKPSQGDNRISEFERTFEEKFGKTFEEFKTNFDIDFEKSFKKILKDYEERLKSHPSEVSKVEGSKSKWEGFLVRHVAEILNLHLTYISAGGKGVLNDDEEDT